MAGVVGGVAEVEAEPHHRRLVGDDPDAAQARGDGCLVGHVTPDVVRPGVQVRWGAPVGSRQQGVEHDDVVAPGHEEVHHGRADESGTAGDEDPHLPGGLEAG